MKELFDKVVQWAKDKNLIEGSTWERQYVKLAEEKDELMVAQSLAQMFPMAVQEAYEQYLTATGKKNTQKWLEQPAMNVLPTPDQGAASAQASGIA